MSTAKKLTFKTAKKPSKAALKKAVVSPSKELAIVKPKRGKESDADLVIKICGKCAQPKPCDCGRPLFDGKDEGLTVQKLRNAFSIGCTDEEACVQAEISVRALYYYQARNPEFLQEKNVLKEKLMLVARANFAEVMQEKNSEGKPTDRALATSWKYAERKRRSEFGVLNMNMDLTPEDVLTPERKAEIGNVLESWDMDDDEFVEYDDPDEHSSETA